MDKVACYTTIWKRNNLPAIVEAVRSQTIKSELCVWNSDASRIFTEADGPDWVINSTRNTAGMYVSQFMKMNNAEFICFMDDDITFGTPDTLEYILSYCKDDGKIYGAFGVVLEPGVEYSKCKGYDCPEELMNVDIVKYRFVIMHRNTLALIDDMDCNIVHHDIGASGLLAKGRPQHNILIPRMRSRLKELPDDFGLCNRGNIHYFEREVKRHRYFGP